MDYEDNRYLLFQGLNSLNSYLISLPGNMDVKKLDFLL